MFRVNSKFIDKKYKGDMWFIWHYEDPLKASPTYSYSAQSVVFSFLLQSILFWALFLFFVWCYNLNIKQRAAKYTIKYVLNYEQRCKKGQWLVKKDPNIGKQATVRHQ